MPKSVSLNVDGKQVKSTEVTYDDLVWLYKDFEKRYGRLPTTNDGKSKFNMPQQRIIKRVLEENNVQFNDFMNSLGKVKHVRTETDDYDSMVNKFICKCNELGNVLQSNDLINNTYGLPSVKWFITYCPDKSVSTYTDFVKWCGFDVQENTKEFVSAKLIELEKSLNRPITTNDINAGSVGFSMIVVTRIWGTLGKCKDDIGLMKTKPFQPKPFSYYKSCLDDTLAAIACSDIGRDFISWKDIENPKYTKQKIEHKTYTRAFKKNGTDIFAYIKSKGLNMNPSNFSFHYTFEDGERVVSSMEYDFSRYIKDVLGFAYNKDYERDVMYRKFLPYKDKSRINCDYVFHIDNNDYYVEIAGIIDNSMSDWTTHNYSSKQEQGYQQKMILKRSLLDDNRKHYLFLFPDDFRNDSYKKKLQKFIGITDIEEVA